MSSSALQTSMTLSTVNITDVCAPVEGCTGGLGQRYVIRFTTRIENIGTTDYYIGSPSSQPQMFSTANCHGHAHYQGYADYILFDQAGNAIPVGFKNGFCVIDVGCYPGNTGQYGCSNMGISKGCYDIYGSGTTCNWIDVTNVPAGALILFRMRTGAVAKHCGILCSPDHFIHAYERTGTVEVLLDYAWRRRLAFAFLFPES